MMKRWMTFMSVVGVLLGILSISSVAAATKQLYVGSCKGTVTFSTIQAAVDSVNAKGFTIYVCPGTYNESVQIMYKEELTIRNYVVPNKGLPSINASGYGFSIFESPKTTIRGMRIQGGTAGVVVVSSPKTEVRNVLVKDTSNGIAVSFSEKVKLQQNTVTHTAERGIYIQLSPGTEIVGNTVADTPKALQIATSANLKITDNTILGSSIGMSFNALTDSTVSGNTVKNNDIGLLVDSNNTNNTFKQNVMQGNNTDAGDTSSGTKTAGTANTWSGNSCDSSFTPGGELCSSPATP